MGNSKIRDIIHFHQLEDSVLTDWHDAGPAGVDKHTTIQEREVSYHISSYQHSFVQQLMKRLIRQDISALLAADTEFVEGNPARPGSAVFTLDSDAILILPEGAQTALTTDITVPVNGAQQQLAKSMAIKIGHTPEGQNPPQARAHAIPPDPPRVEATLLGDLAAQPEAGSPFTLPDGSMAVVRGSTTIQLENPATIVLFGGATTTLPAGTVLVLNDNELIHLPNGTNATFLRGERLPVFFGPSLAAYQPSHLVKQPHPVKELDFNYSGAYSVYNWELFFHIPLTVAIHLMKNGRFAEAQRWFHYVFDPTDNSEDPTPERFWKVLPFQTNEVKRVENLLVNMVTGADPELRAETLRSINDWQNAPFQPHTIARTRQGAYMLKTVMAYLDNLIAWGDSLFRQDTGEAIDEALMLYVLAANILGPRPQAVTAKVTHRPQTYHRLRQNLKQFGSAMLEMEAIVPFDFAPLPGEATGNTGALSTVRGLGRTLFFCVPRNETLLSYWDTVADRLFKIRNSLNIAGIFRQLALFEPPIDPALLARGAAAGLDVSAIVNGLNQPLPLVRFQLLVQKASEIVQEVKSLGNNLLSVMEKEDNEALALLRARHERVVMEMVEQIKIGQLREVAKAREGLLQSLALAVQRYTYYERQLGAQEDEINKAVPQLDELDKALLKNEKLAMREPQLENMRDIDVDIATDPFSQAVGGFLFGKLLSSYEVIESGLLDAAQLASDVANIINITSSIGHALPSVNVHVQPFGLGSTVDFGGPNIGSASGAVASSFRAIAERINFEARRMARMDNFDRRSREWTFQSNLAAGEINQIFKQLRAAQIREAVAEQELASHRQQMKHAEEIERFLNEDGTQPTGKKTNKAFYVFEKREIQGLYRQCFQLAFDVAKKAERALQHELGDPALTFLQFGYLAGKEGLLAGEKLYLDIKRMEMAYLELNQREYELIRHVSLLQLDPLALVRLRTTGRCTVRLPEELFDMDGPGHYFRRIKSVAVSIPCVTGPYVNTNCKLTLLKSSIRKTQVVEEQYARVDSEDKRFSDFFGSLQSIVASSAQNDSGLFETNLRDERYLPFENSGVVSEWQLELPANPSKGDPALFDYETISDVIIHIRYTAREGGSFLRNGAIKHLKETLTGEQAVGTTRLFSVRHEFPTDWARFINKTPTDNQRFELALILHEEHYPFWSKGRLKQVKQVILLARSSTTAIEIADIADRNDPAAKRDSLTKQNMAFGDLLAGSLANIALPEKPVSDPRNQPWFKLFFDKNTLSDMWIAVTWHE